MFKKYAHKLDIVDALWDEISDSAIETTLEEECLIPHPSWMVKLIQLYETQKVRHGIMVIGPSGAGKSKCITVLAKALTQVEDVPVKEIKLNPKSITDGQMHYVEFPKLR